MILKKQLQNKLILDWLGLTHIDLYSSYVGFSDNIRSICCR